jgi:hypothetical protein
MNNEELINNRIKEMVKELHEIFKLEDLDLFEQAYDKYQALFFIDNSNFEIWKHYYFFLWTIYEDAPMEFQERIKLEDKLQELLKIGLLHFSDKAEYYFLIGYTINIFPYLYGEYNEYEEKAIVFLKKACEIEPNNLIYQMCLMGADAIQNVNHYNKICEIIAPIALEKYKGIGYMNTYFRQILYRIDKKYWGGN